MKAAPLKYSCRPVGRGAVESCRRQDPQQLSARKSLGIQVTCQGSCSAAQQPEAEALNNPDCLLL